MTDRARPSRGASFARYGACSPTGSSIWTFSLCAAIDQVAFGPGPLMDFGHHQPFFFVALELRERFLADILEILLCQLTLFAALQPLEQQCFQPFFGLALFVVANQLADILAHAAVAPFSDLI